MLLISFTIIFWLIGVRWLFFLQIGWCGFFGGISQREFVMGWNGAYMIVILCMTLVELNRRRIHTKILLCFVNIITLIAFLSNQKRLLN